jgi:hypothetical protein
MQKCNPARRILTLIPNILRNASLIAKQAFSKVEQLEIGILEYPASMLIIVGVYGRYFAIHA